MASAATIGTLSDALGRNSYEVLAHALGVQDEPVLDLACGDGYLLELVRRDHDCLGVDWNAAELSAASRRLGSHAPLARADAADLPIATRSFGAVLCHYALMLLQPLEGVLAELARILRPGGLLAAVLPRASSDSTPIAVFRAAWKQVSGSYPSRFLRSKTAVPGGGSPRAPRQSRVHLFGGAGDLNFEADAGR